MADEGGPRADVEIVASAAADWLRFETRPEVRISFPGTGRRDSRQVTRRQNIDTRVEPGKTYHRVLAATRINSRLLDYENRTLGQDGAGLAASRLAHKSEMIKEKAA